MRQPHSLFAVWFTFAKEPCLHPRSGYPGLGGLLLLTVAGLIRSGSGVTSTMAVASSPAPSAWAPLLLLLVGVDLARLEPNYQRASIIRLMTIGVLGATLLFVLWGWAAIGLVPLQRLAATNIAPVLVAKQAWGQWGRYLMGVVTIAGTLAAVNALFYAVTATTQNILRQLDGPHWMVTPAALALILSLATAAAMAFGMAGTEGIDLVLRAGLILWLLYYAIASLVALQGNLTQHRRLMTFLAGSLLLTGAGLLVFTDPDRDFLLTSMLGGLATASFLTAGLWGWVTIRKRSS